MKKSLLLLFVVVLFSSFTSVFAQEPPKVMLIVREEIKPGMMGIHTRHSGEFVGIFNQVQTPNHRLALVPVAGNENEVMYLSVGGSFAELEGMMKTTDQKLGSLNGVAKAKMDALDKEAPALHANMRDMLVTYRPEISFQPGVDIAKMRYFSVSTVRIRPGYDSVYIDYLQKMVNVARQKAKADNLHIAVFSVVSGAPNGTYMLFRPMRSLAEMDDPIGARVRAAMSDDQRKEADKMVREAIISGETSTYAFAPGMSYLDKEFTASDPSFWAPKPSPMAMKIKPRRRAPKPPSPPPAN